MGSKLRNIVLAATILVVASIGIAQIPGMSILDHATVQRDGNTAIITVNFTCSISYLRHYPENGAKQLQIRIKPLPDCQAEPGMMHSRDMITSFPDANDLIDEISYEGNDNGEPTLHVDFTNKTSYEVKQGKDFRSIVIKIF